MDINPIFLEGVERRRRRVFPVNFIGGIVRKNHWVSRAFATFNLSFLLRGTGEYRDGDRVFPLVAPCVFTQWPGEFVRYGPDNLRSGWDEMYFIYGAHLAARMTDACMVRRDQPVWSFSMTPRIQALLDELMAATFQDVGSELVERMDWLCEGLIMETRPLGLVLEDPELKKLQEIHALIEHRFLEIDDVDALAGRYGFSRSSFRRLWKRIDGRPPYQFLMDQRLNYARRLLVETDLPIGRIAEQARFGDPLYFSRKFSRRYGQTASAFRADNRIR